jgi:hypothetical protein
MRLHDKVHRRDVLERAWRQVRANRGAAGIDRQTIKQVERYGVARLLDELEADLRTGDYRMLPARRAFIPKPGSGERRPLSIPAVRDRIVQAAVKIVIEPIFEADFQPCSSQTRWILDAYPLAVAALLPLLFGAAGDRYGRRAAFTIGPFGFAAASVVGALTSTPEQLIGAGATLGVPGR